MATPILDQTHLDLAYKLQDPVTGATVAIAAATDGIRITADERERYIIRGYRRLLRMVTLLYPKLISHIYHKFYKTITKTTRSNGTWELGNASTDAVGYVEIFEVLAKETTQETYVRAQFVNTENWLSIKQSLNVFYTPSLNNRDYFWCIESGDPDDGNDSAELTMLPAVSYNIILKVREDVATLIQDGSTDLDLTQEYVDLLLSLACMEAYLDIGQPDMAKAYQADVVGQLQLLTTKTQSMEQKDEA